MHWKAHIHLMSYFLVGKIHIGFKRNDEFNVLVFSVFYYKLFFVLISDRNELLLKN